MDLTTETRKVKGLAESRAEAAVSWREREENGRWLGLGPCVLQGCCWNQTENLNKDGSHQWEGPLLFDILEDHGKKVILPPWSLVGNVITDGIFPGGFFHMAHQCDYICCSFGYKLGIRRSIVSASCCALLHFNGLLFIFSLESHVITWSVDPGGLIQNSTLRSLPFMQERERGKDTEKKVAAISKRGYFPSRCFPLRFACCVFSHLGCPRAKWVRLLFKNCLSTPCMSPRYISQTLYTG